MMTISMIIPVRDGSRALRSCLEALQAAAPAPDEIIVVDDGSRDDSGKVATECGARVIRLPEATGPACARNRGARQAKGAILFFVDADVAIHPDAIKQVTRVLGDNSDVVAVFGCYDDAPAEPNFLSQYRNLLHHYVHQTGQEEASTFWAGCGAIRRDVFMAMDGFDEAWRHKIEDIELGSRLRRAGHRIRLCKSLQGKHLKRWTTRSLLYADFFVRALPWTRLILRERHFINDLNLHISNRVCVASSFLLAGSLVAVGWWSPAGLVAGLAALVLLILNVAVYRFFLVKRGWWFTLRVIPWHWFYFLYSGVAFTCGVAHHLVRRRNRLASDDAAAHPPCP